MTATSTDHARIEDAASVIEACYEQGWTDGLPTVPCSESALAAFLATTTRAPDEIVLEMPHLDRACTVRLAAVNAIMAGCRPDYFPVVLAAWDAMAAEGWAGSGMWQSTTGLAPGLVIHGPIREQIDVNSGASIFGPGTRANATIARALRLAAGNVFGLTPGTLDQSTQGTPGKYYLCFGENQEQSPWPGHHETRGFAADDSAVTAISLRSVVHLEARQASTAEQLLFDIAGTIARTGALLQETVGSGLVLSPEHAHLLADQGFDRNRIRAFLREHATITIEELRRVGKDGISAVQRLRLPADHPDAVEGRAANGARVQVLHPDDEFPIIVAGAWNCGISAVVERFGTGAVPPATVRIDAKSRDIVEVEPILRDFDESLRRDGFGGRWSGSDGVVRFEVRTVTADCADCLVPEPVLRRMLDAALQPTGWQVGELVMPDLS